MTEPLLATPGLAPAGGWRTATVREVAHPHPRGVVLRLEVPDRGSGEFADAESGVVADREQCSIAQPLHVAAACLEQRADGETIRVTCLAQRATEPERRCLPLNGALTAASGTERVSHHRMIGRQRFLGAEPDQPMREF